MLSYNIRDGRERKGKVRRFPKSRRRGRGGKK